MYSYRVPQGVVLVARGSQDGMALSTPIEIHFVYPCTRTYPHAYLRLHILVHACSAAETSGTPAKATPTLGTTARRKVVIKVLLEVLQLLACAWLLI